MARPYTEAESSALKKEALDLYEKLNGKVYLLCQRLGIVSSTFYYWKEHDLEFNEAINEIQERLYDIKENIYEEEAFKKRNMIGMIHYLKKKMRHRGYGDDQQIVNNFLSYTLDQLDHDAYARKNKIEKKPDEKQLTE